MFNRKFATPALQNHIFYLYRYIWSSHGCLTQGKGNLPLYLIWGKTVH